MTERLADVGPRHLGVSRRRRSDGFAARLRARNSPIPPVQASTRAATPRVKPAECTPPPVSGAPTGTAALFRADPLALTATSGAAIGGAPAAFGEALGNAFGEPVEPFGAPFGEATPGRPSAAFDATFGPGGFDAMFGPGAFGVVCGPGGFEEESDAFGPVEVGEVPDVFGPAAVGAVVDVFGPAVVGALPDGLGPAVVGVPADVFVPAAFGAVLVAPGPAARVAPSDALDEASGPAVLDEAFGAGLVVAVGAALRGAAEADRSVPPPAHASLRSKVPDAPSGSTSAIPASSVQPAVVTT
jgi:hypothetical protein